MEAKEQLIILKKKALQIFEGPFLCGWREYKPHN